MIHRHRRHFRLRARDAATLLVVAALAGCGTATPAGEATPAEPPPPLAAPVEPVATVAAIPPPAAAAYPRPETLNGLDADKLAGLLGAPRFKRRDDPAEIWQYRNDACSLDVFLYRAGKDGAFRVRYFETRGRDKKPVDQNDCFASLLKGRGKGGAG